MTKTQQQYRNHNYFSDNVLSNMDKFVRDSRKALKDGPEFDTFVVRGMSGAIAGGILARSLDKHLWVIRKPDDSSHDSSRGFGTFGTKWMFLDDFVSTGNTFWRTYEGVEESVIDRQVWDYALRRYVDLTTETEFVGAFLYAREGVVSRKAFQSILDSGFYGENPRQIGK